MSLYDNFHAPQYVDFTNLQNHDASDASEFFARDHETTPSRLCDSSVASAFSSDGERTLTPGCAGSLMSESISSDDSMDCMSTTALHISNNDQSTSFVGQPTSTPFGAFSKCVRFEDCAMSDDGSVDYTQNSPKVKLSRPKLQFSTPMKTQTPCRRPSHCLVPEVHVIPPTPSSSENVTPAPKVPSANHRERNVSDKKRRRSRSVGSIQKTSSHELDDCQILQEAIESLVLSAERKKNQCHEMLVDGAKMPVASKSELIKKNQPQQRVQGRKSVSHQVKKDSCRPKRKLSPPPTNARDYSGQPAEKYMSVAEHVAHYQNQLPSRFLTLPASVSSKKVQAAKKVSQLVTSRFHADIKDGVKTVKVPRRLVPKVEPVRPIELVEYKKPELPKTVFYFDKGANKALHNRRTPTKFCKPPTKVQPFSFDLKTQEIMQRKLNRSKGIMDSKSCCHSRRRSKSVGAESTSNTLVHHAKPASVLYKPAFVPVKPNHKIVPLNFELSTAKRAREREQFDAQVQRKEKARQEALNQLREKQKQAEERELLKMREERTHKANPMPVFHNFKVQPSSAPLTEPHGPKFLEQTRQSKSHSK